jgi:hypothetical protein
MRACRGRRRRRGGNHQGRHENDPTVRLTVRSDTIETELKRLITEKLEIPEGPYRMIIQVKRYRTRMRFTVRDRGQYIVTKSAHGPEKGFTQG